MEPLVTSFRVRMEHLNLVIKCGCFEASLFVVGSDISFCQYFTLLRSSSKCERINNNVEIATLYSVHGCTARSHVFESRFLSQWLVKASSILSLIESWDTNTPQPMVFSYQDFHKKSQTMAGRKRVAEINTAKERVSSKSSK